MIRTRNLVVALALVGWSASMTTTAQTSGTCGDGVNWDITGTAPNQTLTISYAGSGTGVMTDYTAGTAPWYAQRANLTTLVIGSGVTTIGNYAFYWCQGFTGSLTIPNSVTTIGEHAFDYCQGFTGSLTIPNSVTTIGNYAFYNCAGFTGSLTIGNSVTSIGNYAFNYCQGFTGSLTIPNSVTTIGEHAFDYCAGFTGSLTIGNSVTSIGNYAFYYCWGFTGSLTISNSVTTIGGSAFYGCYGFTGSLTIGNSVDTIGDNAFSNCYGFTGSLTIPNSVTTIGANAFYGCYGFTDSLTIPNSVTTIGSGAFFGCSGFTDSLTIPNSVTSIGNYAFRGCYGFTGSLTIPNLVTSIGNYAFANCSGFTGSLTIGNSVTSIEQYAFYDCSGFTSIVSLATAPPALGTDVFSGVSTTIPVSVPSCSSVEAYQLASGWSSFSNYSPDCQYTVQWGNTTLTYNGYPQAPTATAANSLGQSVAVSVSGAETNAGSGYTATASTAAGVTLTNTTTTFDIASAIVPVQWGNTTFIYNGLPQTPTATATGVLGEDLPLSVSGEQTNAGEYTATASLSPANSNYALSGETTTFNISTKVGFTWQGGTAKCFNIFATNGEDFNVDWGDGTDENQTGTGTNQTVSYSYSADGGFTVTVTGTANCNFGALLVASLQITELDLSAAYNLKTLYCENNQISSFILPLTPLTFIQCFNNSLQLSDLYAISETISSAANKRLGTQTLPQLSATVGEELFDAQSVFGGIFTEYEVESATIGTDYEVTDGKLSFLSAGTYTVTMTNATIVSHASYPAKVVIEIVVN